MGAEHLTPLSLGVLVGPMMLSDPGLSGQCERVVSQMRDTKEDVEQTQVGCGSALVGSACFLPRKLCRFLLGVLFLFFFLFFFLGGCCVLTGLCERSARSQSTGSNISYQERTPNASLRMWENYVFPSDSTSEPSKTELSFKC